MGANGTPLLSPMINSLLRNHEVAGTNIGSTFLQTFTGMLTPRAAEQASLARTLFASSPAIQDGPSAPTTRGEAETLCRVTFAPEESTILDGQTNAIAEGEEEIQDAAAAANDLVVAPDEGGLEEEENNNEGGGLANPPGIPRQDFSGLRVVELKVECRMRGLQVSGRKNELIGRLNDYYE